MRLLQCPSGELGEPLPIFGNFSVQHPTRSEFTVGSFSKYDGNLNGDVLRNKRIVHTKQREQVISSPNGLINNVLVL